MTWNRGLRAMVVLSLLAAGFPARLKGQGGAPAATPERALARDVFQELIEINTTPANGCTKEAKATPVRLRSAGCHESDVLMAGPRPEKQSLVVRLRGRGQAKPILRSEERRVGKEC